MSYTDLYVNYRRSTRFSLGLVVAALASVMFFTGFLLKNSAVTKATQVLLEKVEVGSLQPTSASVYVKTEKEAQVFLLYGNTPKDLTLQTVDGRPSVSQEDKNTHHFFLLKDLTGGTTYYFVPVINNKPVYMPSGEPFTFTTPKEGEYTSNFSPLLGKALERNGKPLENGIVIARLSNGLHPFITHTKVTGEWLVPLYVLPPKAGGEPKVDDETLITLEVYAQSDSALVQGQLKEFFTSKTITLGTKRYLASEKEEAKVLAVQDAKPADEFSIVYPLASSKITTFKPLLRGTGKPGTTLSLYLNAITKPLATVTVASDGTWKYTPKTNLTPGAYTLYVVDKKNNKTLARNFIILKSGEQVLGEETEKDFATLGPLFAYGNNGTTATNSAMLTPTATPTIFIPTPTTPLYITATPTTYISATPTPPVSGNPGILVVLGSILFIIAGIVLMTFS